MSLLSYMELCELVERGVINAPMANVNAASIDITLGDKLLVECLHVAHHYPKVDLANKDSLTFTEVFIGEHGYMLEPGEFVLGQSCEVFNMPNTLAAEYKLKSSLARCGLQHLLAGWADPGWNGSVLTLELHNITKSHDLLLRPGMKIGQMVFWRCAEVPADKSYASVGQYNGDRTVQHSKGLR